MQFLADVYLVCESCGGKRFKEDILDIYYRGKNIDDVLNLTVDEAVDFFSQDKSPTAKKITKRLYPLQHCECGLDERVLLLFA